MIVIVSISKLDGRIQVGVAKSQHHSKSVRMFSEAAARKVLFGFGVDEDAADLYLKKLLPQISENQELTFPPMDIPQHELMSQGFHINARAQTQK